MGFSGFWSQLTSPRVKEMTAQPRTSNNDRQRNGAGRRYHSEPNMIPNMVSDQPTTVSDDRQERRKSQAPSLHKQKSAGNLKKRKSWFGSKPAVEEDIPAMPTLPVSKHHERNRHIADRPSEELARPGTALTTNDQVSWSRAASPDRQSNLGKRKSIFGGRNRSQSSASQTKLKNRQSWFGSRIADSEEAPPMPPVPAMPGQLVDPQAGVVPPVAKERRVSKRLSLRRLSRSRSKSDAGASQHARMNSWQKLDDHPLPPMPALVRDDSLHTPESSVATTRSPVQSEFIDPRILADSPMTVTRQGSIKQPRPVSGVSLTAKRRRSYVPKNAANGFLKSTTARSASSGGGTDRRGSHRHSLMDDGEGGVVCLNEEQQREWDKLKHLMEVMEKRQDDGVFGMLRELEADEDRMDRAMFSNVEALAALEFGEAR